MNKELWAALFAHPFPQAVILFVLGICCLVLPDAMSGLGLPLTWPLPLFVAVPGLAFIVIGFGAIIMCHTAVFAEFKKAYDARNKNTDG
jgi:hypothetical protein